MRFLTSRAGPGFGLLLSITLFLILRVPFAGACSCVASDPRDRLDDGQVAMVGVVLSATRTPNQLGGEATYRVRVEREANADLPNEITVREGLSGTTCDFTWHAGQRVAAFLRGQGATWSTNLCSLSSPDEMEQAMAPLPPARRFGRMAFLAGGRFGAANVMALDLRGRAVGYGPGRGETLRISICPRSRRSVELTASGGQLNLTVRDLRLLRVKQTLGLGRIEDYEEPPSQVRCADRLGHRSYVTFPLAGMGRTRVVRVRAGHLTSLAQPPGYASTLGRRHAYVAGRGYVTAVSLRTGETRRFTATRDFTGLLAESPDGKLLAIYDRDGLRIVDQHGRTTASVPARHGVALIWLGPHRFLFRRGGEARVYATNLRLVRRYPFYRGSGQTPLGHRIFGTDRSRLVALDLTDGSRDQVATLPDPDIDDLAAVPGRPPVGFIRTDRFDQARTAMNTRPRRLMRPCPKG
jgi:hypothetical protein